MEIQSRQHAVNRKAYLQRMLDSRPEEQCYMGDGSCGSDWVEQENRHNERLEKRLYDEIDKCDKYLAGGRLVSTGSYGYRGDPNLSYDMVRPDWGDSNDD